MGHGGSKEVQSHLHEATAAAAKMHFPNTFTLFYESSWKRIRLHLAEDKAHPLYTFDLPKGWYGDMIVYDGPDPSSSTPVATAAHSGKWRKDNTLTLPPLEPGQEAIQEEMKPRSNGGNYAYPFVALVKAGAGAGDAGSTDGPHKKYQPMTFEWVSSASGDVKELGEVGRGWKLVQAGQGSGSEVFAAWADSSMSLSKAAKFHFVGRGATDEMGDAWRLMVVVSFAKVWQRCMEVAVSASAA